MGRDRVRARLEQLLAEYEPTPVQQQLLAIAARHLDEAERARDATTRTRAANAAGRLLRLIARKADKQPLVTPLDEYLERKYGPAD